MNKQIAKTISKGLGTLGKVYTKFAKVSIGNPVAPKELRK
ncbi:hypothetical protein DAVIES_47 [Brevibacillus phage Davies]|uniref:Uncharacterized protein n=1 Tax=Brevibacillus phage Davies TaxID=1296662 RepID=S5M6F0_9CAUD|nr:hypothetical protein DAVIES_47 [Brevibacillus phage Davies]AGR47621.2 hypothetical protein DAVIES_47 [Brevibacillus phage Davies]